MKRQPSVGSGNKQQEHSVERLKTCIADLKKLASNKVKRTGGTELQTTSLNSYNQNSA
jgi:hypothetical protein